MGIFLSIAAMMVAAALAFVAIPLLRHRGNPRATTARRLHALDSALAAGVIDASEYAAKRAALATADAVAAAGNDVSAPTASSAGVPSAGAPPSRSSSRAVFIALMAVALLLPASALLLYRLVGTPQALDPANLVAQPADSSGDHGPQMEQAIAMLVARLAQHPDDAEGWSLLGRACSATARDPEALDAFKHAHAVAPDNAAVTVEYAQALAVAAPDHRIEGESRHLLENVLASDPHNQRALWLLGISDYQSARYDAAIARWNILLPLLEPGSSVLQSVKEQIATAAALRDGKVPPSATPAAADTAASAPATSATPVAPDPSVRLSVKVSLDAKLKDRVDPESSLFVYARAAKGPPMPLAIQRLKAAQLPLTITLDESMGMLPAMKLSMFPKVVIGARISKSGNALPQSGDLQTLSLPVDVHRREPVELVIDQVVP